MNAKIILIFAIVLFSAGCNRSNQTWEDVKTAGRYMQRGVDSLWGKDSDSRLLSSNDEFIGPYDEFIPMDAHDLKSIAQNGDFALPQPKGIPGTKDIPFLDKFYYPSDEKGFQFVHFDTDQYVLQQKSDIQMVHHIAQYLKNHPKDFLLIEGHTDERASASYNMALGVRRANFVRHLLVKEGVDPNQIYTLSRGKERPVALGHFSDDWKQNRRAEFKIFEKQN